MQRSGTEKIPKTVWGILLSYLKRWKKVNLVLGNGAAQDQFFRCSGYMSSLESLRMSVPDFLAQKHYNAFQVAPRLTELDLAHPGYTAIWEFPWAQLTKLKLEISCQEYNLWGVLFQLENIEELRVVTTEIGPVMHPFPLPKVPIIRLPSLRLFETSLAFHVMFSWLTSPLLEHLHIHGCNIHNYFLLKPYQREIMSLIQRSSCHLRRLAFEDCTKAEMLVIMGPLASVEELTLYYPKTLGVIQDVMSLHGLSVYLPKLQVLQVTCYGSFMENGVTVFSRLLEARVKGLPLASQDIVPLEKLVVQLTLPGKFPDEVVMHGWPSFAQVLAWRTE